MGTRIEPGRYKGRAISWAFGMTGTGKPQIGAVFDVQTDEGVVQLTWYGFLNDEKNAKRTMSSMRAMGWDGNGPVTDAQGMDANDVDVTVEDNEWEGETTSRIAWVNGAGAAVKPMKDDERARLNAKLAQWQKPAGNGGSSQKSTPKAPPPKPNTPTRQETSEAIGDDGDIPF